MKKINILYLLEMAVAVVFLIIVAITNKYLENNKPLFYIILGVSIVFVLVFVLIIDKKIKQIKDCKQKEINFKNEQELIEKLTNKKDENEVFKAMYLLYTKQCIEINELIKDKDLIYGYDFSEKDNYYEVSIESNSTGKQNIFYSSISSDNNIILNDENEYSIINKSSDEIIELIYNDIQKYLLTLK